MNRELFSRFFIILFAGLSMASCNSPETPTPTTAAEHTAPPAMATISAPTTSPTPRPPTPTKTASPSTPTPLAFTATSIPLSERIVYYYDINYYPNNPVPEGAIDITIDRGTWIGTAGFLASTYADEAYTHDTAADLRRALEIVLRDKRNLWASFGLEAVLLDVTFDNGHATVRLQGNWFIGEPSTSRDVFGPLVKGRMAILLTVFANPAVQTAAVWLNDDTIGNLGISDSKDAKPASYVFTRAQIEAYLKEHTYVPPPTITPTPTKTVPPSTAEAALSATPAPITLTPGPLTCQLNINQKVDLVDGTNLWSQPDVVNGILIGALPAGTSVFVINGPQWGRIVNTGVSGWWWEVSLASNGASAGWIWEGRIEACK